ncbi:MULTISPECIES: hypothetical protein [Yersinia]|nr:MULTISPECIES: hypothetical protein [Yersinia]CQH38382.1 Uncharacterised protein [Yersinia frederiksenii]
MKAAKPFQFYTTVNPDSSQRMSTTAFMWTFGKPFCNDGVY